MTDHILDGYNLEGMTFPTKSRDSELWQAKVPNFCPKCEEIRADLSGGTPMANTPQTLSFKSFGMCTQCYLFQRDHPEEAEANSEAFQKKQAEIKEQKLEAFKAHRFRVYLLEVNERLPNSPYAASVTNTKFTKYPSKTSKGVANHTIPLLTKEEAESIVETLLSKSLTCWYDDSEYEEKMNQA